MLCNFNMQHILWYISHQCISLSTIIIVIIIIINDMHYYYGVLCQ